MQLLSDLEEEPQSRAEGEPFQDETLSTPRLYYRMVEGGVEVTFHDSYLSPDFYNTLEIPNKVKYGTEYSVVSIDHDAFHGCTALQEITIPATVTEMGYSVFEGCTGLTKVSFSDGINISVIDKSTFSGCTKLTNITIPESVTTIQSLAFEGCTSLPTINIPQGVTTIYLGTFSGCTGLQTIVLPKTVTTIEDQAFMDCTYLESITIPKTVTKIGNSAFFKCNSLKSVQLPDITLLDNLSFAMCNGLTEITIPRSVTQTSDGALGSCKNLKKVTILNDSIWLDRLPFAGCTNLASLSIAVKSNSSVTPARADDHSFDGCPADLNLSCRLTFLTEDGLKPLDKNTTPTFEKAKEAYDLIDGTEDGKWWGWIISEDSEEPEPPAPATYTVTIQAQLNGIPWNEFPWDGDPWNKVPWSGSDHPKKSFALRNADGDTYDLTADADAEGKYSITVADGEYEICERIETPEQTAAREISYRPANVTVDKDHPNATVNYYTATFYDGSDLYDNRTDQRPQIVLEGTCVAKPPNPPDKSGLSFDKWKTEDKGSTDFNFASPLIGEAAKATNIYASWKAEEPKSYFITAKAGEGGFISPKGIIEVPEGTDRAFTIRANTGYRIKSVYVDEEDLGALTLYTFPSVSRNHTIEAVFEKTEPGGGDEPGPDTPGGGGGTDPDNPGGSGGGGGSDPDDSDDDHSGGGSDAGGSGGGNSGGGTSDSGSDTGSSGGGNSGGGSDTGSSGGSISDGGSAGSTNISAGSSLPEAGGSAKVTNAVSGASVSGSRPGEPKTGDASHLEVYASIAMIAGFVYLILYLMDGMKGMSEEEKNRRIASLLGWAKRGRAKTLRRYIAITAVFFVLAYYHAFGKQAALGWQKA